MGVIARKEEGKQRNLIPFASLQNEEGVWYARNECAQVNKPGRLRGEKMKNLSQIVQYGFLVLFVLSAVTGLTLLQRSQQGLMAEIEQGGDEAITKAELEKLLEEKSSGVTTSYITMGITLAGFIVSTVMNVRKERREAKEAALNLQKMELELEKMRMELDAMKRKSKEE
jgi:preprotein translocase subunit SecG